MKFNIISYTLFLIVIIMLFPSLIYAWTESNPPIRPAIVLLKDCARWIQYNGFSLEDYPSNRYKAFNRDHSLDKKASTWAAMYAFRIGGKEDMFQMLPKDFCKLFGREHRVAKAFKALEEETRYCEDWITLYGFSEYDQKYNSKYALNFRVMDDETVLPIVFPLKISFISLWPYFYYLFVKKNGERFHLPPIDFCQKIGKNVDDNKQLMPYMNENDTYLTCKNWIYLYEFNDDPEYNANKSYFLNNAFMQYPLTIQEFPSEYCNKILKLLQAKKPVRLTPETFCKKHDGDGDTPREYNYEKEDRNVPQVRNYVP